MNIFIYKVTKLGVGQGLQYEQLSRVGLLNCFKMRRYFLRYLLPFELLMDKIFFDSYLFHKTTNSFKTLFWKGIKGGVRKFSISLFPLLHYYCKLYPRLKKPNRSSSQSKP